MSCLQNKIRAGQTLDDFRSSKRELDNARKILNETSCHSCNNPIVRDLGLDDMLCERKQ